MSEKVLDLQLRHVKQLQCSGKTWQAMEKLKELVLLHPQNAMVHKLLGNAYFHMGLLDWAIDSYRQAIAISKNYLDARYDLGVALYHRARITEAISEFQDVLKIDPEYHSAHYRIGLCYHHAGQLNAAIHHLLESTVVTPDYVMAFYHLGVIYYKQREMEKARQAFERVLEEDPQDIASAKYLEIIAKQPVEPA
ncbi:MAG: tetratricopeptide repeat protein [bacterium]